MLYSRYAILTLCCTHAMLYSRYATLTSRSAAQGHVERHVAVAVAWPCGLTKPRRFCAAFQHAGALILDRFEPDSPSVTFSSLSGELKVLSDTS